MSAKPGQEGTITQSQLTVTVKEYRPVSTKTVKIDVKKYAGRVAKQKALEELIGKVKGKEDVSSFFYRRTFGTYGDPTRQ